MSDFRANVRANGGETDSLVGMQARRDKSPLVTVIALCYNHGRYLEATLDSIRLQTYWPLQLVIIDDASRDGSPRLIQSWLDSHDLDCDLLLHDRNLGICASLNDGLSMARGDYIAIVATDDVWLPEKIATQVARLESLPTHVGVSYGDAAMIDTEGRRIGDSVIRFWGFEEPPEGWLFMQLLRLNPVPAPTALVRKACFEAVGAYDESLAFEDLDMWLRVARRFHFSYVPEVLALYRIVPGSLSRRTGTDFLESMVRIHLKCFGVTPAADRLLRRRIPNLLLELYRKGDRRLRHHVWAGLRLAPSPRMFGLFVLVRLGIQYSHVRTLERLVRWPLRRHIG